MKDEKPRPPPDDGNPFQRFADFARRLMGVPKVEIDERAKEYERDRDARRRLRAQGAKRQKPLG